MNGAGEKSRLKARLTSPSFTAACMYDNDFIIQDAGVIATPLCSDKTWLADQFSLTDDKYCSLVFSTQTPPVATYNRSCQSSWWGGVTSVSSARSCDSFENVSPVSMSLSRTKRTRSFNLEIRLLFIFSHYFLFIIVNWMYRVCVCVCVCVCVYVRVSFCRM